MTDLIYTASTGLVAKWSGGAYIDLGHFVDRDTGPYNDKGEPTHRAGDFRAVHCLNVWDYANDKATIPFTLDALRQKVEDALGGE